MQLGRISAIALSGAAFLAYAFGGIALSSIPYDKAWAALHLISLALAFVIGTKLPWPRAFWLGLVALVSMNSLVALWDWWSGLVTGFEGYQGLFGNPNIFGCLLVIAFAAALTYRFWWFLPFGALGFAEIRSRGSLLALGFVLLIWLWQRYRVLAIAALCLSIAVIGEMTLRGWSSREIGILARLGVWQDTLAHLSLWGSGFGSFYEAYATWTIHTNMTLLRPSHAYNDFLELVFELGLGSIFLWTFLALIFDRSVSLICWAFLALSLTYFPLTLPVLGHLFAFALGNLLKEQRYGSLETDHCPLHQLPRGGVGAH